MAKILWITGEYFHPVDNGMYRYSSDVASGLVDHGHDIHFLGRDRHPNNPITDPAWTLLPHRSPPMGLKMLSHRPAKVAEIWDRTMARKVRELAPGYDLAVIDHLRSGAALSCLPDTLPVVHLSHNDETAVRARMIATARGLRRIALGIDLAKMGRFEDKLLNDCHLTSAISGPDADQFRARGAPWVVESLPMHRGDRLKTRTIDANTPRRVSVISTLFWGAKIDNMELALEGLAPLLQQNIDIEVFTGGYLPPSELMRRFPAVTFHEFVPDLNDALAKSRVGVVYEPVGGGFKMKTLDFVFRRVPLVTGTGSVAGLPLSPGSSVLEVESHLDLASTVGAVVDDFPKLNSLQNAAFEACEHLFTVESLRPLSDAIDGLVGRATSSKPNPVRP
ncbi:MAG: hypothetical protein ACN4GZ_15310 [Acidimicrobiales bacterium]